MGVTGLWKLIEPCGKPVPVETLEGKILAVDISIWMHQVIKGFQDNKGSALPNAHLLGLFHRLCKLLYYRVKPVFVFDGCVPQLKRDTIARRQQQRSKLNTEAERIQALLLQSLAKEKVVQQALGANAELLLRSPTKRITAKTSAHDDVDDMFKLPELPASSKKIEQTETSCGDSNDCYDSSFTSLDDCSTTSADDSSSFDDSNARHSYNTNLQAIDVKSQHFLNLPADVRHEILVDIKETRKQSSWGRLHELPSKGDDFSTFQMKRLLKRRAVQESLEVAEQEMGGRTLTYAELNNLFTEEGILEQNVLEKGTKQICSDEHTRFLLVRDLKKKLKTETTTSTNLEPSTSTATSPKKEIAIETKVVEEKKEEELGGEFDTDLELALAMSLEDTQVYSQSDYKYESNEQLKLNRDQRKRLQNAAIGPARAYMIEFGGLNEEEVEGIMDKTQAHNEFENSLIPHDLDLKNSNLENVKTVATVDITSDEETIKNACESQEIRLHMSEDSDTDTDLEEVVEPIETLKEEIIKTESNKPLQIIFDLKENLTEENDLFADVFETDEIKLANPTTIPTPKDDVIILESQESQHSVATENAERDEIVEIQDSENFNATDAIKKEEIIILDSQDSIETADQPKPEIRETIKSAEKETEKIKLDSKSILSNLKSQLDEIKNINLNDIKLGNSVIELSDEEGIKQQTPKTPVKAEVIEICDSDDALPTSLASKSPNLKTPTKSRSILEYFPTDYVVKRTPDKDKTEDEDVPKVKSPFFVNRTPKSKRNGDNDKSAPPTPTKKGISKASKSLFETASDEQSGSMIVENDGVEPLKLKPANTEDLINEAAQMLKEQKTEEELQTIATDLAKERKNLESERNRQDRMGMSISQRMSSECQELLRLFGIPYIVAPMEAEAQCAFLDSVELTNGTITDDSDIWLFGGRTVYKNFFAQNKHVLEFRAEKIEHNFSCDRKKLIQLACLVGSDYTTGVHGIGAVTALEILASFTPSSTASKDTLAKSEENIRDMIAAVIATLSKFRDWWLAHKSSAAPPGTSARLALRKKLKNIELHESFPSLAVIEAYLTPTIDENRDTFSWGSPDVESIREYAKKTFGWTSVKTNEILTPILKRLNEKKSQSTIRNYFGVKSAISVRQLQVSKRVQKAIDKMSGLSEDTPEKPAKPKMKRATRPRKKTITPTETDAYESPTENGESVMDNEDDAMEASLTEHPSTSQQPVRMTRKREAQNLHSKQSDIIPQREKDKAKMEESKAKAAEVMKKMSKTETTAKKKRKS